MRMRSRPSPTDENRRPGFPFFSCFQRSSRTRTMGLRHVILDFLIVASSVVLVIGIPTSLVDEIKSSELRDNKVKRAHPDLLTSEENGGDVPYYGKPSAIKRGTNINLKSSLPDQQSLSEWEREQSIFRNQGVLPNIPSSLYNSPDDSYDDKTIAEYEKGFRYGTNKDKLDEALENAVLKSELYGEPGAINQYRYYGADEKKRKRREVKKLRFDGRIKREVDLTPEEILALLSLYENNRQRQQESNNYRQPWNRYEPNFDINQDESQDQDEENWLDNPVFPHATGYDKELGPKYMVDQSNPQIYDKKGRWGGFGDNRKKRFMVSKKRSSDPTREIRYLNGPNKNDFYTLSQLLSNQREPNVPVYHRLVFGRISTLSKVYHVTPVKDGVSGSGTTTRYWACCKPSCSWRDNLKDTSGTPVESCAADGTTVVDEDTKSACDDDSDAYMCSDQQPTVVNSSFALGYVAASFTGGIDTNMCCACLQLTFQGDLSGKQMVVQVTNTGSDLGSNQFDIAIPGGGVGIFTQGCSSQWGAPSTGWGDQYGGASSESGCSELPSALQEGCKFRFEFMEGVANPAVTFEQVDCPSEIVAATGCNYS